MAIDEIIAQVRGNMAEADEQIKDGEALIELLRKAGEPYSEHLAQLNQLKARRAKWAQALK